MSREDQVVKGLDSIEGLPPEVGAEELGPVVLADNDCPIFFPHQLGMVDSGRFIHQLRHVVQTANVCPPELLLEQPKRPIWGELRVANHHEADLYPPVETS